MIHFLEFNNTPLFLRNERNDVRESLISETAVIHERSASIPPYLLLAARARARYHIFALFGATGSVKSARPRTQLK